MNQRFLKIFAILLLFFVIESCSTKTKPVQNVKPKPTQPIKPAIPAKPESSAEDAFRVTLPAVNREFRGAWVATVANINWPSKNSLSTEQQKAEVIKLLDLLKDNNFNAVIYQVRPSADAMYKSNIEPWSYFISGEIGKEPFPYYDPLEFWIEEAHKRGLELHVWLNPYRAHHSGGGKVTSKSLVNIMPDNIVRLKNGMYWMDPASKETQDHVFRVVNDLVKRYDIDAVHFDDYFYPYSSYNAGADFPDNKTWTAYKNAGGNLSRADWRRDNVNRFVERMYREIHAEKSYVKFGISPFGIWKPGFPEGIKGSSQFDELYADAKLWLNKGWVDYYAPQLYWSINSPGQSFPKLLSWWQSENNFNRHLWPGLNTVEVKAADRPSEIVNQVKETREIVKSSPGAIHWSIAGLTKNYNMQTALKNNVYQEKVLVPRSPWLKIETIETPQLIVNNDAQLVKLNWNTKKPKQVFQWVLFAKYNDTWETEILTYETLSKELMKSKNGKSLNAVAIKAIDRLGNESDYSAKKIK